MLTNNSEINIFKLIDSETLNIDKTIKGGSFHKMIALFTSSFSSDYSDTVSANFCKAELIYNECCERGWTVDFYEKKLKEFIIKQQFPTFTVANFFAEVKEPKLFDYNNYLNTLEKSPNQKAFNDSIEKFSFGINGKRVMKWCYRSDLDLQSLNRLRELEQTTQLEVIEKMNDIQEYNHFVKKPRLLEENNNKLTFALDRVVDINKEMLIQFNRLFDAVLIKNPNALHIGENAKEKINKLYSDLSLIISAHLSNPLKNKIA